MTLVGDLHADLGATYEDRGGRQVVSHYGRPATAHKAVRRGVGVVEMGYGVVVVSGEDRVEFVDNVITNRVPERDGQGVYALLLSPQGRVETDMYVYNAGERLLLLLPPERTDALVEDWASKVFIQDVAVRDASADFGVFGVHGPSSTEKIASVLNNAGAPEPHLSFVRGAMRGVGVTVVATDAPLGEEGYEVVCTADGAAEVFDTLLTLGNPAAPFGYRTWNSLTLEAGTPLFAAELDGRLPNVLGVRNALDFEKGCFVGQEVVSKVENRGQPSQRLVGLRPDDLPESGATVSVDDEAVGTVTRAVRSPMLDAPIALALVTFSLDAEQVAVEVDGERVAATRTALPFVDGGDRSDRIPTYR